MSATLVLLIAGLGLLVATCTGSGPGGPGRPVTTGPWSVTAWLARLEAGVRGQPGHLQPGSDPAVLPAPVLVADEDNSRLLLIDPKGRVLWTLSGTGGRGPNAATMASDDAFFGPHGGHIVATQESQFSISVIALPSGRISWQYGRPGISGAAPGYLDNPDDALLVGPGEVLAADIKNCRILLLRTGLSAPLRVFGQTTPYCIHQPPDRFGSPNGVFPLTNGDWLVTEINGDWVDEMTPTGGIAWSIHPPGVAYPSDTNEVSPNVFLTADYSSPGQIETFDSAGRLLWRYRPAGLATLNHPSLALPLPNGDVLFTDDRNDRVVVVDPHTDQVVWQYGLKGVAGSTPGYLDGPDGADLAPPWSLLMTHAATMGTPPGP